jgi:hypothetical protein
MLDKKQFDIKTMCYLTLTEWVKEYLGISMEGLKLWDGLMRRSDNLSH